MSMVLIRSPLISIGMNGGGSQKRRSARLSQEANADAEPLAKKAKFNSNNSSSTAAVSTKQQDGDNNKAGGKRKQKVYDEEVEGFTFTKGGRGKTTRSKKAAAPEALHEDIVTDSAAAAAARLVEAPTANNSHRDPTSDHEAPKTTQKKTRRQLPTTPDREVVEKPARRSKRLSNEKASETIAKQVPQRPTQKPSHSSPSRANTDRDGSPSPEKAKPVTVEKKRKHGAHGVEEEKVMTISLPFADTPIIRRNREMRKNSADAHRRSSAGMRGKRASSLIDEGRGLEVSQDVAFSQFSMLLARHGEVHEQHDAYSEDLKVSASFDDALSISHEVLADNHALDIALPHSEVPTLEFFKHISAELTEPRRMRCLLGWCGTRSLPQKPDPPEKTTSAANLEFQARQAARVIQEELSQDLVTKGSLSDWFSRDDTAAPPVSLRKKANPRNISNAAKAEELERELERLKKERAEWDEVAKSSVNDRGDGNSERHTEGSMSPMRPDALDSAQCQIYEQLQASASDGNNAEAGAIQQRLKAISEDLEFAVDAFAHGVHALSTARHTAERVAERSLAEAASALGERDKQRVGHGKPIDQMDALRGLARVLNAQYK